jgi:hypothetical protein
LVHHRSRGRTLNLASLDPCDGTNPKRGAEPAYGGSDESSSPPAPASSLLIGVEPRLNIVPRKTHVATKPAVRNVSGARLLPHPR